MVRIYQYVPFVNDEYSSVQCRYHAGEEIQEDERYVITMELDQKLYYLARLEISSVESFDRGEYRAVAKNKYGVGTATINLNFEEGVKPK